MNKLIIKLTASLGVFLVLFSCNPIEYAKKKGEEDGRKHGEKEGAAMYELFKNLDDFYASNSKYPETLTELNIADIILILGSDKLDYKKVDNRNYTLKFAGLDYILDTSDDKVYKGLEGTTTEQ